MWSLHQLAEVGFPNLETTARDQIIKSQFMNDIQNDLHCQLSWAFQYKIDDASLKISSNSRPIGKVMEEGRPTLYSK